MFGANKKLRDLGKDSSSMYNPSALASSDNRPYVINTKEKNGKASSPMPGPVKIFVFIYVGLIILGVIGGIAESFEDFDFINNDDVEEEYFYVDPDQNIEDVVIFEQDWANKYYTYLTKYNATTGIEKDEITFVDLDFNNIPEMIIYSESDDFVDYVVEIDGDKMRMYYFDGNIKDMKLYSSKRYNYDKWGVITKNNPNTDYMTLYFITDAITSNELKNNTVYSSESVFNSTFYDKGVNVVYTKLDKNEDKIDDNFKEAIDNYKVLIES